MNENDITGSLTRFDPITLDAISSVRLMNRVEFKYIFSSSKLSDFINLLPESYQVLEISDLRMLPYSTTYMDTPDSLFYYQHLRGKLNRHKIRYRKYEATGESFLEIKKKTNTGRTIKWRIENSQSAELFDIQAERFMSEYLPVSSSLLKPSLVNGFSRVTFAGLELKERITIDFNISFACPVNGGSVTMPYLAIAELKKEGYSDFSTFRNLVRKLRIYPTGFSKYCIGSALIYDSLKKNMIKPKLLLLNKIENEYTRSSANG